MKWKWLASYYWTETGATYTPKDNNHQQPEFVGDDPVPFAKEYKEKYPPTKSPFTDDMPDQIMFTGMTEDMKFQIAIFNAETLEKIQ